MARHLSFDDPRVGKKSGNFFKPSGNDKRPQRIAYIPGEALMSELVVSPALRARASRPDVDVIHKMALAGDPRAQTVVADMKAAQDEIYDIGELARITRERLSKQPVTAQIWTNEHGVKVVLYPKAEQETIFWIKDVGPVKYLEGLPSYCLRGRQPETIYGCVILEYELDKNGDIMILPEDRQVDLGGGHKISFRYELKLWSLNDFKSNAWKEAARRHPLIFHDFDVWTEQKKEYTIVKFGSPAPALWRQDPLVMQRIICEARKIYADISNNMARNFSRDEILDLFQKGDRPADYGAPNVPVDMEQIDFSKLLGGTDFQETPALEHDARVVTENGANPFQGQFFPDADDLSHLIPESSTPDQDPLATFFPNN